MTKSRIRRSFFRAVITLMAPYLLALAGVRLALTEAFLQFEYQRSGFPADVYGLTTADRMIYGSFALKFLFNGESISYLAEKRLPQNRCWGASAGAPDCALFKASELSHMQDVKGMMTAAYALALLCLIIGGALWLYAGRAAPLRRDMRTGLRRGAQLTLAIVAALATLSLASWDVAFDGFHQLFFAAGTWQFPYSDSLIRLYPERIFMDGALIVGLIASAGAVGILALLALTSGNGEDQARNHVG